MNRRMTAIVLGAALVGFVAGYALKSAPMDQGNNISLIPSAQAQAANDILERRRFVQGAHGSGRKGSKST